MSYNIRLDIASDGADRWSERRDFFVGEVALMKPGLLGLQEVVPVPPGSQRIDYVLADSGVAIDRHAVLAWHGDGGRVASDHWPVIADLRVCR